MFLLFMCICCRCGTSRPFRKSIPSVPMTTLYAHWSLPTICYSAAPLRPSRYTWEQETVCLLQYHFTCTAFCTIINYFSTQAIFCFSLFFFKKKCFEGSVVSPHQLLPALYLIPSAQLLPGYKYVVMHSR